MTLVNELKRRNVFKVTIAYVVMAWLVMQVADVILNNITAPGWIFHVLLLFLAIGLPFAVFFAWAFELTPEGLKREQEVDHAQSITHKTGRKLDFLIIGALVVALGYIAYDKFVLDASRDAALVEATTQALTEQSSTEPEASTEPDISIAVLPFVNMSDDASNEYFSDGLSEELLNLLAKVSNLRVIARTSSFAYKGKDIKIAELARELDVSHILEGSVRKAGDQVRITAQLVSASDSSHLWSQTWDRTLVDIFAIQDEIAAEVTARLEVSLLGELPTAKVTDPAAYALYLQARQLGRQRTPEGWEQSNDLYRQVLDIDPGYAAAGVGLAGNYMDQSNIALRPVDEGYSLAREAARRALAIDPGYAKTTSLLGRIALYYDRDLAAAARHFERALALAPNNPDILLDAANLALGLGRIAKAVALLEYARALDPVNPVVHFKLGGAYYHAGRLDDSIRTSRTALRLSPGLFGSHGYIALALLLKGEPQVALDEVQQESFEAWRKICLTMVYHALGRAADSDNQLKELIDKLAMEAAYNIASILAFRGEADRAFEWLEKAVQNNDPGFFEIAVEPLFTNIHDDPRWLPFLERVGRSPKQLAAIEFEVTLPE